MASTDPRESQLASLIVELAKIEAGQAEAKKVMKEVREDLEEQIQRLAAEIESGQAELFEAPSEGQPETTCAVCGAACSTTVSISTPGGKPTPPSCLKCMKKATDADRSDLYPERVGCSCRVVLVSETDHICPLIVEFPDGWRGIAEPEWLAEPC